MIKDKHVRKKGKAGKPLVRVDIATSAIKDRDDILYENNYRAVYFLGVLVYRKRLRMAIGKESEVKAGF